MFLVEREFWGPLRPELGRVYTRCPQRRGVVDLTLEQGFNTPMLEIYRRADDECGYTAERLAQMRLRRTWHAKAPPGTDAPQYGPAELWEHGRLDLTVAAHVPGDEFSALFTPEQRERARARLLEVAPHYFD